MCMTGIIAQRKRRFFFSLHRSIKSLESRTLTSITFFVVFHE